MSKLAAVWNTLLDHEQCSVFIHGFGDGISLRIQISPNHLIYMHSIAQFFFYEASHIVDRDQRSLVSSRKT